MVTSRHWFVALATGSLLAAATACAAPGSDSGSSSSSGPIKIAVVDAQSGQLSSLGAWELKGAKLAVQQVNAKGGIDGRKVKLSVFDDQGDPTTGTSIARKIVSGGYTAMIGTAESAVTQAMNPILKSAKIPSITSGQATAITELGSPYQFLNGPTSATYDNTLEEYLTKTKSFKTFAMITNNGGYGVGEHDAFTAALKASGIEPVVNDVVTPDQKDFSAVLTKIRSKKPDVLFIGTEEVEAGLIAKQARQLGLTAVFAGSAPLSTPVYVQTAGADVADGTLVSTPYLSNDATEASKAFAAAYQKAFGETAELHGAKSYDGTSIFLAALKQTKGKGGLAMADAVRAEKYDGLLGSFDFDDKGVGIHQTVIGVISGGKLGPAS
ncbi:ABC transporter substrate-binding protein [Nocardioides mangrovicus]|nr:ABC transporter substrate-binding protein [Nocardioides mangrovicus]